MKFMAKIGCQDFFVLFLLHRLSPVILCITAFCLVRGTRFTLAYHVVFETLGSTLYLAVRTLATAPAYGWESFIL